MITERARAKINLCLHITGKRPDGYHELDSLVVFPDIADVLTVQDSDVDALTIDGPFARGLSTVDNLVLEAAALLRPEGKHCALHLTKNLPVASGIGGGSADAAAALRLLGRLWDVPVPVDTLPLGADVPVCVASRAVRMRGIGEVLDPLPALPDFSVLLVNSGVAVSTGAVFTALGSTSNAPLDPVPAFSCADDMFDYLRHQRNDMQQAAIDIAPEIGQVLAVISGQHGCDLARMSGSGATCFGLFRNLAAAQRAARNIAAQHPNWWAVAA